MKLKIEAPKDKEEYMALLRSIVYLSEKNLAPEKIRYPKDLMDYVDGDLLAKRLGLICFEYKEGYSLESNPTVVFTVSNKDAQKRWVTAKDFQNQIVKPINPEELLFVIDPSKSYEFQISFVIGDFSNSARFSLIEGYRMNKSETSFVIEYETTGVPVTKEKLLSDLKDLTISKEDFLSKL